MSHDPHAHRHRRDGVRDSGLTGRTVSATAVWCDDGGRDLQPDTPLEASVLAGIEPSLALFADGMLYVREGAEPPAWTERWFTVPSCRSAGTFEIAGEWTGVDPSREARFDGDLRLPYRVFMHVDRGPRRYVGAQVKLRATASTRPALGPTDVRTALWESGRVTARVRCHAGSFKAVELHSVPIG